MGEQDFAKSLTDLQKFNNQFYLPQRFPDTVLDMSSF